MMLKTQKNKVEKFLDSIVSKHHLSLPRLLVSVMVAAVAMAPAHTRRHLFPFHTAHHSNSPPVFDRRYFLQTRDIFV